MIEEDKYCIDISPRSRRLPRPWKEWRSACLTSTMKHCVVDAAREEARKPEAKIKEASDVIAPPGQVVKSVATGPAFTCFEIEAGSSGGFITGSDNQQGINEVQGDCNQGAGADRCCRNLSRGLPFRPPRPGPSKPPGLLDRPLNRPAASDFVFFSANAAPGQSPPRTGWSKNCAVGSGHYDVTSPPIPVKRTRKARRGSSSGLVKCVPDFGNREGKTIHIYRKAREGCCVTRFRGGRADRIRHRRRGHLGRVQAPLSAVAAAKPTTVRRPATLPAFSLASGIIESIIITSRRWR